MTPPEDGLEAIECQTCNHQSGCPGNCPEEAPCASCNAEPEECANCHWNGV